jgi:hypothetical protein
VVGCAGCVVVLVCAAAAAVNATAAAATNMLNFNDIRRLQLALVAAQRLVLDDDACGAAKRSEAPMGRETLRARNG